MWWSLLSPPKKSQPEREFVWRRSAACHGETRIEDDEIGERMDAGQMALLKRGDKRSRPLPAPWKMGMLQSPRENRQTMWQRGAPNAGVATRRHQSAAKS